MSAKVLEQDCTRLACKITHSYSRDVQTFQSAFAECCGLPSQKLNRSTYLCLSRELSCANLNFWRGKPRLWLWRGEGYRRLSNYVLCCRGWGDSNKSGDTFAFGCLFCGAHGTTEPLCLSRLPTCNSSLRYFSVMSSLWRPFPRWWAESPRRTISSSVVASQAFWVDDLQQHYQYKYKSTTLPIYSTSCRCLDLHLPRGIRLNARRH